MSHSCLSFPLAGGGGVGWGGVSAPLLPTHGCLRPEEEVHLLAPGPPTETSWPPTGAPAETQMTVFYKHSIYFIFK